MSHGLNVFPDDARHFRNSADLRNISLQAPTPTNWDRTFAAKTGSSQGTTFLGWTELERYEPSNCAAQCSRIGGCQAINIYFERTPKFFLGQECQHAPSMSVIKCVFWGEKLYAENVTNYGHTEWEFDIAMAGSNGYNIEHPDKVSGASA
ncbi:hypothetical protein N0V83_003574 [Neocucurbitaria cava]|uniref:Apple domain-containing protein n=1 Tax=Neocucurbitaria cava TaxID=798079 RepID=A0A9W8YBN4_9PLEO|nr:hypothetical protein N0V83_003574 [Neocucurbitaria cava]